jgi:hypothetical protein
LGTPSPEITGDLQDCLVFYFFRYGGGADVTLDGSGRGGKAGDNKSLVGFWPGPQVCS